LTYAVLEGGDCLLKKVRFYSYKYEAMQPKILTELFFSCLHGKGGGTASEGKRKQDGKSCKKRDLENH